MSDDGQMRLFGDFEEAREADIVNSPYFKPETNTTYTLTFTNVKAEPDPRHPHYKLGEKEVPDFNDKNVKVKKTVLILQVESVNGKQVSQEWSIMSKALRETMVLPCTTGSLLRKKYMLKVQGEGNKKTFAFAEAGEK